MNAKPFKPHKNHQKVCGLGVAPYFIQKGRKYDAGHNYIGKADDPKDTPEKRAKKKDNVKARAAAKIGNLDGFKTPERPEAVESALSENQASRDAEAHAE